MNRRDLLRRVLSASAAFVPAWAQDVRFETGISEVHVDAAVKHRGELLHELKQGDFVVRDEGAVPPILAFEEATTPLDLVVLQGIVGGCQCVEGFRRSGKEGIATGKDAVRQMRPGDRVAVISFSIDPHLDLPLTSDADKIAEALQQQASAFRPGVDPLPALQWGIWLLEADVKAAAAAAARKRAILMLTLDNEHEDGSSNGYPDDPLIRRLWGLDVAFHAVVFGRQTKTASPEARAPFYRVSNLWHIAKATGGEVGTEGQKSVPDILADIRSTYSISYRAPEAATGSLRHITVELSDAAKKKYPGAEIRAREGYFVR